MTSLVNLMRLTSRLPLMSSLRRRTKDVRPKPGQSKTTLIQAHLCQGMHVPFVQMETFVFSRFYCRHINHSKPYVPVNKSSGFVFVRNARCFSSIVDCYLIHCSAIPLETEEPSSEIGFGLDTALAELDDLNLTEMPGLSGSLLDLINFFGSAKL